MTTKRLLILFVALLAGMGSVTLLPKVQNSQPSGIDLDLPPLIGDWYGKTEAITEKEISTLGAGTEFARKSYRNDQGDELYVSIVLAGQDMNTSIHRPERCLPAQGWTIADSQRVAIPLKDSARDVLQVTRLHNMRPVRDNDGHQFTLYNLNYYWFVGCNDTTPSHFKRTYFDIRDRLLKGYNQRWAYVTVVAIINNANNRTEQDTDRMIKSFIQLLVPKVHKSTVKYG
jgi:EpsI family protein